MNVLRKCLANGLRRRRSLMPISSEIHHNHNFKPFNPSQSMSLPPNGLSYLKRGLSVNASDDSAKPKSNDPHSAHNQQQNKERHEDVKDDQTRVLEAALQHVPKLGWAEEAMVAGARDAGLSPSIIGAFPRKEAALVEYFMDDCLQRLVDEIKSCKEELSNMVLHGRIAKLLRIRLEMQAPYISKWAQALSIQANPLNLPTSFKQRAILMDEIWCAAGDRSTDIDRYTNCTLLGGVYTASEIYMLTDHSPEFQDTWTFLDLRVKDAVDCRKTVEEATQLAATIGAGLGNTLQQLFLRRE
eukprot:Gb_29621 [translate_table: standard]